MNGIINRDSKGNTKYQYGGRFNRDTLLFAMLANLILLPSLLLSLERSIANKEVLKEPHFRIIPEEDKNGDK